MEYTRVTAKVITDNSGVYSEIPILLTEHGALMPLLDYLLAHQHDRSQAWANKVVQATSLLLDYMTANENCFADPRELFRNFVQRLYTGTIGDNGDDLSGLFWLPKSEANVRQLLNSLNGLADWLADEDQYSKVKHMNPLRKADGYEQRLNYMAWHKRNQHDFLGHTKKTKATSEAAKQARNIRSRHNLSVQAGDDEAPAFPEERFMELLDAFTRKANGKPRHRGAALRDMLITLLLHGTGARESEPFHLYIQDVFEDPTPYVDEDTGEIHEVAMVRLYHPEEGISPDKWKSRTGNRTRAAYLKSQYCMSPRNKIIGTQHAGWKSKVVNSRRDKYMHMWWFPREYGVLFWRLWNAYMRELTIIKAHRQHHPFAFVSFEKNHLGQPYTLQAYRDAYVLALRRMGLKPSKYDGLSAHGHRHAMGQRLTKAKVNPLFIMRVLHHKSLASQLVYTQPGVSDVSQQLNDASKLLSNAVSRIDDDMLYIKIDEKATNRQLAKAESTKGWDEVLASGFFSDIDPDGLLSGQSPLLGGHYL